jgi:thiopeptide-type bacteriocin biosynthesis protein
MMKLTLSTVSICRTPVFSIEEELNNVWDELKTYIQESSPEFYELIKNLGSAALTNADVKLQFTVWKYFNRARFRATPYGNFASFSLVPLSKENHPEPIRLVRQQIAHRFPNWKEQENINPDPKWLLAHASYVRTNTSAYSCGEELRYMNVNEGFFELSATVVEDTMMQALSFCHTQRTISEVQDFLQQQIGLNKSVAHYFLQQLVHFQLLLTDFHPNIIGTDYFKRINYTHSKKDDDYIIAERKRASGTLSEKSIQVLPELSIFLSQHLTPSKSPALQDFKEKFRRKYEGKRVPLLVVMDPEIGLGYRSLTQDKEEDQLVQDLNFHRNNAETATKTITYAPIHQFILEGMIAQKTIDISAFTAPVNQQQIPLGNTISILLHPSEELLVVAQIGGCTANALLGRFTMASDELIEVGQQNSTIEHTANPGVLFFDIAYQIEKHADNINRRRALYPYELPILSWSESGQILDPDDIVVSVRGDEIILHSIKYGKRIVPKLASAYNYGRSDLSIYRFLSDLQYQNLHASLAINMLDIFPGLSHYQRVQYKNVVLSTEKWLVPQEICTAANPESAWAALAQWLITIGLKKPFKCGFADQTLVFNPSSEQDKKFFLLYCKNKTQFYIEETFPPAKALVSDEKHSPYLSEFIVNLQHQEQLYRPFPIKNNSSIKCTDTFVPGSEWLYFEIYCHPSKSDQLLLYIVKNYLSVYKKQFKNWFFIRYNDPSYHIRLRVNVLDLADLGMLMTNLSELLSSELSTGIISDLQIKTYRRENERYGANSINVAEKFFGADSKLILSLINNPQPTHIYYQLSISLLEQVFVGMQQGLQQQLDFAEMMANSFAAEMKIAAEGFKKINIGYKSFLADTSAFKAKNMQAVKIMATAKALLKAVEANTENEKWNLVADFFHMHINRFFSHDQRMHELIIYHYLTKMLKTNIARSRQMP